MSISKKKALYIAPRALAVLYILFLGVFALDVFSVNEPLFSMLVGFIMHLIPNFILLFMLLIAWKYEKIGGVLFIVLSCGMAVFFNNSYLVSLYLFGPMFLIGVLFITHGMIYKPAPTEGRQKNTKL